MWKSSRYNYFGSSRILIDKNIYVNFMKYLNVNADFIFSVELKNKRNGDHNRNVSPEESHGTWYRYIQSKQVLWNHFRTQITGNETMLLICIRNPMIISTFSIILCIIGCLLYIKFHFRTYKSKIFHILQPYVFKFQLKKYLVNLTRI